MKENKSERFEDRPSKNDGAIIKGLQSKNQHTEGEERKSKERYLSNNVWEMFRTNIKPYITNYMSSENTVKTEKDPGLYISFSTSRKEKKEHWKTSGKQMHTILTEEKGQELHWAFNE